MFGTWTFHPCQRTAHIDKDKKFECHTSFYTTCIHTEKSFRNLIKSTRNQIVLTIFWLIWIRTDVRLDLNHSENGKYNLISVWFNKISKRFLGLVDPSRNRLSSTEYFKIIFSVILGGLLSGGFVRVAFVWGAFCQRLLTGYHLYLCLIDVYIIYWYWCYECTLFE